MVGRESLKQKLKSWEGLLVSLSILSILLGILGSNFPYGANLTLVPFIAASIIIVLIVFLMIEKLHPQAPQIQLKEKLQGYLISGGLGVFSLTIILGALNVVGSSAAKVTLKDSYLVNKYTPSYGRLTPASLSKSNCYKLSHWNKQEPVSGLSICSNTDGRLREGLKVKIRVNKGLFNVDWVDGFIIKEPPNLDYFVL